MNHDRLTLPPWAAVVIALSGFVSLVATYWDDAWHTDIGRDDATIAPHLWLYGAVAVAGLVVVWWGLRTLVATRSLTAVFRQSPLMVAAAGGAATLAAAPLDAVWHSSFGRDAVLWSPPHMLVVFASTAMVLGVIAGTRNTRGGIVEALLAAMLLGGMAMMVLEYETDVPQFGESLYLPVLLAAGLLASAVARRFVPVRLPVTAMVTVYVGVRLAAVAVLALLDRSTPELPLAFLGLCVIDLPWRSEVVRYSAGAAAVSALAWLSAWADVVTRPASSVAVVAIPAVAILVGALILTARRGWPIVLAASTVLVGFGLLAGPAPMASAHDPGQGDPVLATKVTGISDGRGELSLTVTTSGSCAGMTPVRLVARRAGETVTGPLRADGECRYSGSVRVPREGLWFTYAELRRGDQDLEVWLPLSAHRASTLTEDRDLYRPAAATTTMRPVQIAAGAAIYALGLGLIAVGIAVALRRPIVAA